MLDSQNSYTDALGRAAELWGIEPQFWDIWGRLHVTSVDTKKAILRAMGVAVDTVGQIEQAISTRIGQEQARAVPPCVVLSETIRPRQFPAKILQNASVEVRHEDGTLDRYDVAPGPFLRLPETLPLGY